jgi:F-type H+-transporting ATPase subunit gamma
MPSLKIIRKRISSVKSTQKITKAMKMVAGAKLNRAQQRIVTMRPYAVKTGEVLQAVARSMEAQGEQDTGSAGGAPVPSETPGALAEDGKLAHPLLDRRPEKKVLFVVLSGDRGLCGAFNTNVNKATEAAWRAKEAAGAAVEFLTLGRKGREYLTRRGGKIAHDVPRIYEALDLAKARTVSSWIVPRFVKKEYDAIFLVYNEFKSAISQKVTVDPLLPLKREEPPLAATGGLQPTTSYLYEPDQKALLEQLVPMYVEITLLRALLESQASFFGAQMTAMDSATRNAKDMISRLTLVYNRARQAAITKELMEIIGGAEALKE